MAKIFKSGMGVEPSHFYNDGSKSQPRIGINCGGGQTTFNRQRDQSHRNGTINQLLKHDLKLNKDKIKGLKMVNLSNLESYRLNQAQKASKDHDSNQLF